MTPSDPGDDVGSDVEHGVERVVDARGLPCPLPVIRLAAAARVGGGVIAVWWTDPAAEHDIPAWARMRGHEVLGTEPLRDGESGGAGEADDDAHVTRVRLNCA